MTIGTNHFVSIPKACDYYRDYYSATPAELERIVTRKIDDGEIEIGQPTMKDGQTLKIIDNGQRYAVVG